MKETKEEEKIRYGVRPIRMDDRTWDTLRDMKIKSGVSWNKFLLELVNKIKE